MMCLRCLGRGCKVCGKIRKKDKTNRYGCYCSKGQYCKVCRSMKLEEESKATHREFLYRTYLKLIKFRMITTGNVETDNQIWELFGDWTQTEEFKRSLHVK